MHDIIIISLICMYTCSDRTANTALCGTVAYYWYIVSITKSPCMHCVWDHNPCTEYGSNYTVKVSGRNETLPHGGTQGYLEVKDLRNLNTMIHAFDWI